MYKDGKIIGSITVKPGQQAWDYNVDTEVLEPAKLLRHKTDGPDKLVMINRHLYVQGKNKRQAEKALVKLVNQATKGMVANVNVK